MYYGLRAWAKRATKALGSWLLAFGSNRSQIESSSLDTVHPRQWGQGPVANGQERRAARRALVVVIPEVVGSADGCATDGCVVSVVIV
jgi:hypothetical protein